MVHRINYLSLLSSSWDGSISSPSPLSFSVIGIPAPSEFWGCHFNWLACASWFYPCQPYRHHIEWCHCWMTAQCFCKWKLKTTKAYQRKFTKRIHIMGWYSFYLFCIDSSLLLSASLPLSIDSWWQHFSLWMSSLTEPVVSSLSGPVVSSLYRSHDYIIVLMKRHHIIGRWNEYKILYATKHNGAKNSIVPSPRVLRTFLHHS